MNETQSTLHTMLDETTKRVNEQPKPTLYEIAKMTANFLDEAFSMAASIDADSVSSLVRTGQAIGRGHASDLRELMSENRVKAELLHMMLQAVKQGVGGPDRVPVAVGHMEVRDTRQVDVMARTGTD